MAGKDRTRSFLENCDRTGLIAQSRKERGVVSALNRALFDPEPLIRWRAVTALGWIAAEEPSLLEKVIGRLIYTLNEDSGSIGWMAPQALGEILVNDPDLVEDFFPMVINSIEHEVFRAGVVWAIGRVAALRPDLVAETVPRLIEALTDPSPEVRGLACWALGRLGIGREEVRRLISDESPLPMYQDDQLSETTVAYLAKNALDR